MNERKNQCPVCGKMMLAEFEICDFCDWENDMVQLHKPDFPGGANQMSLNEARVAYQEGRKVK